MGIDTKIGYRYFLIPSFDTWIWYRYFPIPASDTIIRYRYHFWYLSIDTSIDTWYRYLRYLTSLVCIHTTAPRWCTSGSHSFSRYLSMNLHHWPNVYFIGATTWSCHNMAVSVRWCWYVGVVWATDTECTVLRYICGCRTFLTVGCVWVVSAFFMCMCSIFGHEFCNFLEL